MTCPRIEDLAAWTLGETPAEGLEALEDHLFACDACGRRTTKIETLIRRLSSTLPSVLTPDRRQRVEASVTPLPVTPVSPGERATLQLGGPAQIGFWVMRAALGGVERLDCELHTPDGSPLATIPDVPFDAERGEVVLCCQTHYKALGYPDDMVARVVSVEPAGRRALGEYHLHHVFV